METLNKIINLLKEQNKKQIELTDYLGISKNVFTSWKSGKNTSYNKHIGKIAEFLGVSTDYLLGYTDNKNKPLVNNDEELTDYLEELKNRKELRMLFSISKNCTKEEVEQAVRIIEALHKKDDDEI